MRELIRLAGYGLVLSAGVGCATLRPAATPRRAAVTAPACDTVRALAAERANLVSTFAAIGAGTAGAAANAYDAATRQPALASAPAASAPQPGGTASASASTAAVRETQTTVAIWSAEAARSEQQADLVRSQIVRLDAHARALPTLAACEKAGFLGSSPPTEQR